MKTNKYLLILFIIPLFLLSGCTGHIAGKMNDYNELITGEVDIRLISGNSPVYIKLDPSNIECEGNLVVTHYPASNYILPTCKGQEGIVNLECSDGRGFKTKWKVTGAGCGEAQGYGKDNFGNKITFYINTDESKTLAKIEEYKNEVASKPNLPTVKEKEIETAKSPAARSGTAFFISNSGHFITNFHIVENKDKVYIIKENKKLEAVIIAKDPVNDIAIGKINYTSKPICQAQSVMQKGEEILIMGYPLVTLQGDELKATFGRINSLSGLGNDVRLFQIDAPVQPGNSGSPVLNNKGELIGIIIGKLNDRTAFVVSGSIPQNVNYALKLNYIKPLLAEIKYLNCDNKIQKTYPEIIKSYENSIVQIITE